MVRRPAIVKSFWFENIESTGSFKDKIPIIRYVAEALDIVAEDVDMDGFKDIVMCSFRDDNTVLAINLSMGAFDEPIEVDNSLGGAIGVGVADINKDGAKDIAGVAFYSNGLADVAWFENDRLSFKTHSIESFLGNEGVAIDLKDVDLDGHEDIVVAFRGSNEIKLYNNQGNGASFGIQSYTSGVSKPTDVYLEKINSDNYPDLLFGSSGRNQIYYYEGGNSGFGAIKRIGGIRLDGSSRTVSSALAPARLTVGPIDDVIAASFRGGQCGGIYQ